MKRILRLILFFSVGLSVLNSCKKDLITGSVSGTFTSFDEASPAIISPVEGIRIYLFNADFKVDTTDINKNMEAFVGSAITGSDGRYRISNIPVGHYFVLPAPDEKNYLFKPEKDSASVAFTIIEDSLDQVVNFVSPLPVTSGEEENYTIHLSIKNRSDYGSVKIWRQTLYLDYYPLYTMALADVQYASDIDLTGAYGRKYFGVVTTNNYLIDTYNAGGWYLYSYWITWPDIANMPSSSDWVIDWSAQTIKRTK